MCELAIDTLVTLVINNMKGLLRSVGFEPSMPDSIFTYVPNTQTCFDTLYGVFLKEPLIC